MKLFVPLVEAGDTQAAQLLLEFLASRLDDHTSLTDRMMPSFVGNHERKYFATFVLPEDTLAVPADAGRA